MSEIDKAIEDALLLGSGFMKDGKHVPLVEAELVCKDIYMDFHVSEINKQPKSIQAAWKTGRAVYAKLTVKGDI